MAIAFREQSNTSRHLKNSDLLGALKCYIIEDEPLAAEQLSSFVRKHKDLMFIGHTDDISDTEDFFKQVFKIDILFLDIQVGGGSIEQLKKELVSVPFIVVTSAIPPSDYPSFINEREYFILRKPTTREVFEKCIQKIIERAQVDV